MDMERKKRLESAGIHVDEALSRFMGSETMLERYLKKFPSDGTWPALKEALAHADWENARIAAHSLKNVWGTLGCVDMQALVMEQESYLKAGENEKAVALVPRIDAMFENSCAAIIA